MIQYNSVFFMKDGSFFLVTWSCNLCMYSSIQYSEFKIENNQSKFKRTIDNSTKIVY